jgi:large-conductance mechanosensitive channel
MQSQNEIPWSVAVFRRVGYGLLVLALFDLIAIFVPLRLMNPLWQFETMGALVDRVAIPLLGLVLVFFGESKFRLPIEEKLLKALRWLCLLVGLLFFLLIPLGVVSTLQVKAFNNTQMNAQYNQQKAQMERAQQQLNQLQGQQLENFIRSQGRMLDGQSPQQAKEQFLGKINQNKQQMQVQFEQAKANRNLTVLKNSAKWNLGAFVAGILFIYIWYLCRWAL